MPRRSSRTEERGPAVLGVLCRLLDKAEAEDVLVDVFGAVWEKAPSFQPNGTIPFAWMLGLARTKAAERLQALRASEKGSQAILAVAQRAPRPRQVA